MLDWHPSNDATERSYTLMAQYYSDSIPSRMLFLEMLDSGKKQLSGSHEKEQVLSKIVIAHKLRTLCELSDDFATLVYALSTSDLNLFESRMIFQDDQKPGATLSRLASSSDLWITVLRYANLDDLSISEKSRKMLEKIRRMNVEFLKKFTSNLIQFRSAYLTFHNRIKHTNSMFYGCSDGLLPNVEDFLAVLCKDPDHGNLAVVFINDDIIDLWHCLSSALCFIMQDLLDRAMLVIERKGKLITERRLFQCPATEVSLNALITELAQQEEYHPPLKEPYEYPALNAPYKFRYFEGFPESYQQRFKMHIPLSGLLGQMIDSTPFDCLWPERKIQPKLEDLKTETPLSN